MRLGWQLLLPLAALNVIITAAIVALGLPWWLNGLVGLAIVIVVLLLVRSRTIRVEQTVTPQGRVLPTSVRLARFEPTGANTTSAKKASEDKMVTPAQEVKA